MGKGIINFDVEKTNELLAYVAQIKEDGINIDAPKDGNLYGQKDGEWEQAQEQLESGKNIKTLNGVSVLGEGNIDIAPTIGENGNWYINGLDTGKPAKGNDGADGVSLGEIALVQETGTGSGSENKVMSQAAVTKGFNGIDEKINNRTTEYNVSVNHPTSGTDGTNRYDLTGAIAQVPAELRSSGLTVSFLNADGNTEKWEFGGGSWAVGSFSQVGAKITTELENKISISDNPALNAALFDNLKVYGNISINDKLTLNVYWSTDTFSFYYTKNGGGTKVVTIPSVDVNESFKVYLTDAGVTVEGVLKVKETSGNTGVSNINLSKCLYNDINDIKENIKSEVERLEADIAKPIKSYSSLQEAFSYIPQGLRNFGYKGSFLIKNNPKEFKVVLYTGNVTNQNIIVKTTLGSNVITTNYQSPTYAVPYTTIARAIHDDIKGKLPENWSLKDYNNESYFVFEYLGDELDISFNCEETSGSDFEIVFKLEYTDPSSPRLTAGWTFNVGPNGVVYISLRYNKDMGIEDIERDLLNFTKTKSQYATLQPIVEKLDDEPNKYKVVIPYQSCVRGHGSSIPTPPNESTGIRTTIVSSKQMTYKYIIQSVEHKDVEEEYLTKQFVSTDPNNFEKEEYWADYNDETDKLNSVNLWNRIDDTINLDISDGKPIYFSLPMNMNYTAPYTLKIRNLDGNVGMDVTKGYHGSVYIQSVETEMLSWSNRAILLNNNGWCVFKGFSWGMSTMEINIEKTIKPWLANKLFILKEDDFKHYIGVADDYKINIGTRNLATFAGGYNTILDTIFESSPFQNVVLLSTIYNQGSLHSHIKSLSNFDNVNRTIKAISEYWNVPYIDMTKQALFTHKENENLIAKMADRLHPAASNPDVRLYVSISEDGAKSGTIKINQSDWNNESNITIADGESVQSIIEKILSSLSVKANVNKDKNDTYNYVYMSLNFVATTTSQKTTLPTIEANETNVNVKVVQKDSQVKQYATFLSSQLTSLFGDLGDKHILWIGTSIPAGNTYGFATGQKYPELIQEITSCRMTNKSKAGSYLRKYNFYNYKNQDGLTPPTASWNTTKEEGNNTGFSIDDIKEIVNSSDSPYLVVIDMGINDYMSDQGVEFVAYDFEHPYNEE